MSEIEGMRPTQGIYDSSTIRVETIRDEAMATNRVVLMGEQGTTEIGRIDDETLANFQYSLTGATQVNPNTVRNTRAAREDLARRLAEAMPRQPLGVRKEPLKWRRVDDLMITDGDAPPGCMVVVNLEKGTVMPVVREGMSGSIARWVGNRMIEAAAILEQHERTPHE